MTEEAQTYYVQDDTGDYQEASLPSFHDSLPEELKENESLKDMDAAALAKAYVDLKSTTPQIPETPDGYSIPEIPEGLPADQEAINGFKTLAHEIGLTQSQIEKIVNFDFERAKKYVDADKTETEAAAKAIQDGRAAAQAELNKEWGSAKEAKMELVAKVKNRFISEDVVKKWDESGMSDDPSFLKLLADFGALIDEDQLILPDQRQSGDIPRTPDGRPILRYDT